MPRTCVSVIGGSVCTAEVAALGEQLGELLAERGCVVVCGGMSGVMAAVARGTRRRGGECVGLLPGLDRTGAAPELTLSLLTGVGHARNLAVVASGDVVIALGGAWGTLSEIGLARSIGREVVLLESWELGAPGSELEGLHRAADAAQAVELALALATAG
jgi:uncharacterized protein (TIGR00725 family)